MYFFLDTVNSENAQAGLVYWMCVHMFPVYLLYITKKILRSVKGWERQTGAQLLMLLRLSGENQGVGRQRLDQSSPRFELLL